jgi:hypothetical protein
MDAERSKLATMIVKAGEFSWSISRRQTFRFCPRSYWYRYYAAAGGWDEYAPAEQRRLFLLKNLISAELWLHRLFKEAIHKVYLVPGKAGYVPGTAVKLLNQEIWRAFTRGEHEVRAAAWRHDPKKLNLAELYYHPGLDRENFFRQWREKLLSRAANFANSSLAREIWEVPFLDWKMTDRPLHFFLDGIKIWCSPDLLWQETSGAVHGVNFANGSGPADRALFPALLMLMAGRLTRPATRVAYRLYSPDDGQVRALNGTEEDARALRVLLAASVKNMTELIRADGTVQARDFLPAPDCRPDSPLACDFRAFCHSKIRS